MKAAIVVLAEHRDAKYSVNALLAALDAAGVKALVARGLWSAFEEASRLAGKGHRVILGVPLMTEHFVEWLDELRKLAEAARRVENLLLVAGGPHPTGDPVGTLRVGFDVAVVGEGEETIVRLAEVYGDGGDASSVMGLVVREGEDYVFTGWRRPLKLDDYWSFPWWRRRFSPIEVTRGCYWGCRYCETWFIHRGVERHRSVESIVEHVRVMLEAGLRDIRFITPNALGYGEPCRGCKRLELVAEMLENVYSLAAARGARIFYGSFPSEVRPEYVDEDAARLLKKYVSNRRVIIGAQSGSEKVLRTINRGHTVDDVVEAVEVLAKHGFQPEVDFIFGLPGETREDQEATLALMRKLVALGARVHAHTFMPLPGTPLESAPGGRIPGWLRREIYRLIGEGGLYGQWERQERLAARIHELYRRGVILGLRGWRRARYVKGSL